MPSVHSPGAVPLQKTLAHSRQGSCFLISFRAHMDLQNRGGEKSQRPDCCFAPYREPLTSQLILRSQKSSLLAFCVR